jgi:energy-converting hydrogenase Eha subunit E
VLEEKTMQLVALALSVLIAILGALSFVAPVRALTIARAFESPGRLYALAAIRLVLGVVFFLAGPGSREPEVLRILGILIGAVGIITPFVGLDRQRRLLNWWSARGLAFQRTWAAVGFAFGLFLVYAVAPF